MGVGFGRRNEDVVFVSGATERGVELLAGQIVGTDDITGPGGRLSAESHALTGVDGRGVAESDVAAHVPGRQGGFVPSVQARHGQRAVAADFVHAPPVAVADEITPTAQAQAALVTPGGHGVTD
ncbi:hypothetical protein [Mycobacterium riyadhense]|uniref:hypothetical protein n=1 Tax=Mycobacterium riyadhense TaxID=486698 RepID=UPI003B8A7DE7